MSLAVQQNQRKTILIPTIVDDIHAAAVEVALERMGHRPLRWFTSNLPERTTCVMDLNEAGPPDLVIYDYFGEIHASDVDIFWNRRIGKPVIESSLHPSDAGVVKIESERFLTNLLIGFSESSFSVNGYHAAKRAENKAVQLRAAKSAGLAIPPTLITNRPENIRAFIDCFPLGDVIVKPFAPAMWQTEDTVAVAFTASVTKDELPRDELLQVAPAIYQRRVKKAFEIRVTVMGRHVVAVRLDSQRVNEAAADWRAVSPKALDIVPVALPPEVENKCFDVLERLGLVFGCFDFIVSSTGEYVFLEVNQMGQFLWIEESNPEVRLLQAFCDFLASGSPEFLGQRSIDAISFPEVRAEAARRFKEDRKNHLAAENIAYVHNELTRPTEVVN